ncbi:MAG: hypothetical protein WA740_13840 [Candidatus Binataceae bacterium]
MAELFSLMLCTVIVKIERMKTPPLYSASQIGGFLVRHPEPQAKHPAKSRATNPLDKALPVRERCHSEPLGREIPRRAARRFSRAETAALNASPSKERSLRDDHLRSD